jgi:hypothetical protein
MTFRETAKVLAVIAVLLLVLLGIMIAGSGYWWQQNKDSLLADEKKAAQQGTAEGSRLTEKECLDQAMARGRKEPSAGTVLTAGAWLHACLEASRKSPGFCDGVPALDSFKASLQWRWEKCNHLSDSACSNLLNEVQTYCASAPRKAKAAT